MGFALPQNLLVSGFGGSSFVLVTGCMAATVRNKARWGEAPVSLPAQIECRSNLILIENQYARICSVGRNTMNIIWKPAATAVAGYM